MVIHDIKSEKYVQPHVAETIAVAQRDFKAEATNKDGKTMLSRFPSDYNLVHVGWYDEQTAEVEGTPPEIATFGKHLDPNANPTLPLEQTELNSVN